MYAMWARECRGRALSSRAALLFILIPHPGLRHLEDTSGWMTYGVPQALGPKSTRYETHSTHETMSRLLRGRRESKAQRDPTSHPQRQDDNADQARGWNPLPSRWGRQARSHFGKRGSSALPALNSRC